MVFGRTPHIMSPSCTSPTYMKAETQTVYLQMFHGMLNVYPNWRVFATHLRGRQHQPQQQQGPARPTRKQALPTHRSDTASARIFSAVLSARSALALAASAPLASCADTPRFCSRRDRSSAASFSLARNVSFSPLHSLWRQHMNTKRCIER